MKAKSLLSNEYENKTITIIIIIIIIIYYLRDWWLRVNVLLIARNHYKILFIIPTKCGNIYNTLKLLLMRKYHNSVLSG